MSVIIREGMTREGFVDAVARLHGSLRFVYRPMLAEEVDTLNRAIKDQPAAPGVVALAKAMAAKLVSWSEPETPTADMVRRVQWPVFNRLYAIIAGMAPSDPIPTPADADEDFIGGLVETIGKGQAPGPVADEAALGN